MIPHPTTALTGPPQELKRTPPADLRLCAAHLAK
jgi:hypothetical protein